MFLKFVHCLRFFSYPKNKAKFTKLQSILDQQADFNGLKMESPREEGQCKCDKSSIEANDMLESHQ